MRGGMRGRRPYVACKLCGRNVWSTATWRADEHERTNWLTQEVERCPGSGLAPSQTGVLPPKRA